ncbi:hypothetical protein ACJMK2_040924 [Sinanodonta woodiana]|uniref:Uncharacterized protein n=1 Tax=Sinanodonta woodiana TaxID=1069815 RepID=A0ABD3W5Q5_SINWO
MSLRRLLGFDPNDQRKKENFGSSVSVKPATASMQNGKIKYTASKSKLKKLPPISEEGSFHVSPKATPRRATPRASDTPVKNKPTLHVRPLPKTDFRPENPEPPGDPEKKKSFISVNPQHVNDTLVDGLVADYLHYARYGHIIPVYEGTSLSSCPCCTMRNRENVRSLLGFPSHPERERMPHITQKSSQPQQKTKSMFDNDYPEKPLPDPMEVAALTSREQPWMAYQPLPYATNYLNPEFNRPKLVYEYFDNITPVSHQYIKNSIVDADSKFDDAMGRLERFKFAESVDRDDYYS